MNEVLYFIKQVQDADEVGDPVITETSRQVFCREISIGQKEFYQAYANGLQPELKLEIADYLDYEGEQMLDYIPKGQAALQRFRILRTYSVGHKLELVCYREVNPA